MAYVKFLADFDYQPKPNVILAYRAGWAGSVKRDCADRAVAAGKASETRAPRRRKAAP